MYDYDEFMGFWRILINWSAYDPRMYLGGTYRHHHHIITMRRHGENIIKKESPFKWHN